VFVAHSVQHEFAECVKAGTPAGQKQRRGIGLLDNGRPVEHGTRFETGAVINGGIDCALMLGKENARAARTCRATAWRPLFLRLVRGGNAVHRAQSNETQRCLAGKAEGALVRGIERGGQPGERITGFRIERNLEMIALADIADIGEIAPGHIIC